MERLTRSLGMATVIAIAKFNVVTRAARTIFISEQTSILQILPANLQEGSPDLRDSISR
jgi:hypothetical protein